MEQSSSSSAKKVWESVRAYTVQCASCSKWRLFPSKEKYEEIRETINEQPFTCDIARQSKPDISCEKESDVKREDQSWVWAMDKRAQHSSDTKRAGNEYIIRSRAEGGTKFADVYYVTPSNKRLPAMVELTRYLGDHPQLVQDGSFQSPVPFVDNYVAKRRARSSSRDIRGTESAANHMTAIMPYEHPVSERGVPEITVVEPKVRPSPC